VQPLFAVEGRHSRIAARGHTQQRTLQTLPHTRQTLPSFSRKFLCPVFYIYTIQISTKGSVIIFMALPAHSGPGPLIQFRNHFSHTVGLLGRVISSSQSLYLNTGQHKHRINAYTHRHPCLKWDSNPRSQCPREQRQFMPYNARLL
jgi:hypothetical protein